jgi:hypothetical protein
MYGGGGRVPVTGGGCISDGGQLHVNMWVIMYSAIARMYVAGALLLYSPMGV